MPAEPASPTASPSARLRRAARLLLILGLLAHLPCLAIGFLADDHFQRLALESEAFDSRLAALPAQLNLYDFGDASEASGPIFARAGVPWWISETWRVQFLRPLASASLALDHALFGDFVPAHHATGLLLFLLILLLANRVLAQLGLNALGRAVALALIAVDESSVIPVGWLANRNTLIEALLGLGGLAFLGARGGRTPVWRGVCGLVLATLAMGAKESGCVFPVLVAWEWASRNRGVRRWCLLGLGPTLALAGVGLWLSLGAGAQSRFYPEPWDAPFEVALRGGRLLLLSLGASWTPLPVDVANFRPQSLPFVLAASVPLAALAVWAVRRTWQRPVSARLVLAGLALLAPQAAAPLSERLLFLPQMAIAGLLGFAVQQQWNPRAWTWGAKLAGLSAVGVAVQCTALAVLGFEARSQVRGAQDLAAQVGARHVLLAQQAHPLVALAPGAQALLERGDDAVPLWPLQAGGRAIEVERLDERRFRLTFEPGDLLANAIEPVLRARVDPLEVGRQWRTSLFEVRALEVAGDGLTAIELRFAEAPEVLGVLALGGSRGSVEVRPWPRIGERVTWPGTGSAVPAFP
ncbi:MAG: hypothetical protein ACYS26_03330 [Planctomycetota bacterium]|jgi:hypothetical protein